MVADVHPVLKEHEQESLLDLSRFDVTEDDLKAIPVELICPDAPSHVKNGWDALKHLENVYTKTIAFEFGHVQDEDERNWLNEMIESSRFVPDFSRQQRLNLLRRLTQVEGFENFIHRTFVGQKRFSIEGLDILVPMLDELVRQSVHEGTEHILIGMAHRGRLNVLTHTLGKPYKKIFFPNF